MRLLSFFLICACTAAIAYAIGWHYGRKATVAEMQHCIDALRAAFDDLQ